MAALDENGLFLQVDPVPGQAEDFSESGPGHRGKEYDSPEPGIFDMVGELLKLFHGEIRGELFRHPDRGDSSTRAFLNHIPTLKAVEECSHHLEFDIRGGGRDGLKSLDFVHIDLTGAYLVKRYIPRELEEVSQAQLVHLVGLRSKRSPNMLDVIRDVAGE